MKYNYDQYALLFKALSDATRLKILSMLTDKELCGCKILEAFNITQPTLSYHMKILVGTGIVKATKDGSWVNYSIDEDRKEELLMFLSKMLNEKCPCRGDE